MNREEFLLVYHVFIAHKIDGEWLFSWNEEIAWKAWHYLKEIHLFAPTDPFRGCQHLE